MEARQQNSGVPIIKIHQAEEPSLINNEQDKCASPNNSISPRQQLLNVIVVHCWVGPLVSIYWASTWNLIAGEIFFPDDIYASIWISALFGFGVIIVASCIQRSLYSISEPKGNEIGYVLLSLMITRGYTYVMAFASVSQWRSMWQAWDTYTSVNTYNSLGTFLGAYFIMLLLRCSSHTLAPPSVVILDVPLRTYFETTTFFHTTICTWQHILDSLFTCIVLPYLGVTYWRGVWYLFDAWVVPDKLTSSLYGMAIACALAMILLLTRGFWKRLSIWSDERHWLLKYLVEDTHTFLYSLVTILHWRGFWTLYEQDFLEYRLRFWLGHSISYVLLSLSLCSNSLVAKGCERDGMETQGKGIDLDIHYVTHLYRIWRQTRAVSISG